MRMSRIFSRALAEARRRYAGLGMDERELREAASEIVEMWKAYDEERHEDDACLEDYAAAEYFTERNVM